MLKAHLLGEGLQHLVDDDLGLGTRGQDVLVDLQQDLPEPLAADDVADRLAAGAAVQEIVQRRHLLFGQHPIGIGDDVGAGDVGGHFQQQAGVDGRLVDLNVLQTILGGVPGFDEGQGHGRLLSAHRRRGEFEVSTSFWYLPSSRRSDEQEYVRRSQRPLPDFHRPAGRRRSLWLGQRGRARGVSACLRSASCAYHDYAPP
jgi:hypothetical protein